jgi:dUTP pyrophosphatase
MKVKIKKMHSGAKIPKYAKYGDAGMDLTATSIEINIEYNYIQYSTGLSIEIPYGYVGLLFPRSSNSKKDLLLSNSVGVIDSGYRGEILIRFKATKNDKNKLYEVGDAVAQLLILPYPKIEFEEVEELSDSERGVGNFGHTGK